MKTASKLVIYILCMIIYVHTFHISKTTITIGLLSFIIMFVDDVLTQLSFIFNSHNDVINYIYTVLIIAFMILCILLSQVTIFLPVLIMDMYSRRNKLLALIYLGIFIHIIFNFDIYHFLLVATITLLALIIAIACASINSLNKQLTLTKDTLTENELLFAKNNKMMTENQDKEIYLATLSERNRIAREIHDNVGHLLTRSLLQTGAIQTINTSQTLAPLLTSLHESLDTAMTSIRQSVHDLHDDSVDLLLSVQDILKSASHFTTSVDYDMSKNIPKDVKYSFIAIIKEAVNNSIKYSNGDTINITLREHPGFYQLLITDNGVVNNSIDFSSLTLNQGIGLANIKKRVNTLGGTCKITCDSGFKIFISIIKK